MHSAALLLPLAASLASASTLGSRTTNTTSASTPTVTLDYCTVAAAAGNESLGYYKYQNIRYAAVPTGDLRFAAPQWPSVETGINDGTYADEDVDCASEEDCLYLDVWAPAGSEGKSLPVMVFTYGGGFTAGSKSGSTPEGLFDLSKDFIFVGYNYRLGLTGLASGPTYSHTGGQSNAGVWDVEHAFKWTKKYISQFGGNPNEITGAGFSAGGSQTMFQMTRWGGHAEQSFDRAYIMSPGYVPGAGHHHGEHFWLNVSSAVGCDGGDVSCMRNVNFTTMMDAATDVVDEWDYQFQPRPDGAIVPDTYEANLFMKNFNFSGPCVISHEKHESNGMATSGINTTADVVDELRVYFPAITDDVVDELLALYPAADYESEGYRFADMKQSLDLTAKNLALTQALNNETWNARVDLGEATHGTDQNYYWYSTYSLSSSSSSMAKRQMSSSSSVNATVAVMMQKYLLSFVQTGNPNTLWSDDKIHWPKYGNHSGPGEQIVFNETIHLDEDDLASNKSLFWNHALWY